MPKRLLSDMEKLYPTFSKGQKKIADYLTAHYDKAAFMTAAKLGNTVGVSELTVVRFAAELGYEGYPQLQKTLQEIIKNYLTSVQRMEVDTSRVSDDTIITKALTADIEMIKATLEQISVKDFTGSIETINKASKIYIIGVRSASSLAGFMAYYFNLIYDNIVLVNSARASDLFEQIYKITADDVCIAMTFPRYSKQTVGALRYIRETGAKIISITDSKMSPIAPLADHLLIAQSSMVSFVDSLVAPLSLINALIAACARSRSEMVADHLKTLEKVWEEYHVYQTSHDDEEEEAAR